MNIAAMCWECPRCGRAAVLAGTSMLGRQWRECLACGWQATVGEAYGAHSGS
ncbi:MAG TPA: hypothetical protein VIV12_30860 [Streptosporangiaceae bacterium]